MSLLSKLGVVHAELPAARPANVRVGAQPLRAPAVRTARETSASPGRLSNGLKEFLCHLDGIGRGQLLDLGPVSQATLNFFIERGFKVYTEDMLRSWQLFGRAEEEQFQSLRDGAAPPDRSPEACVERFLAANLRHAEDSIDAVLLWDLLDYLDKDMVSRLVARLTKLIRDGGAVFAIFHTKLPEEFHRYRVLDANNLELVPTPALVQPRHVYQNREVQELFQRFRSSKTFVGRDQFREGVFVK